MPQSDNKLCKHCSIKLTFGGYECSCGNYFCIKHLHYTSHQCEYDYKKDYIQLNKITSNKITRI